MTLFSGLRDATDGKQVAPLLASFLLTAQEAGTENNQDVEKNREHLHLIYKLHICTAVDKKGP